MRYDEISDPPDEMPEEDVVCYCEYCGGQIYVGEPYYEVETEYETHYYHDDCFELSGADILKELLPCTKKTAEL